MTEKAEAASFGIYNLLALTSHPKVQLSKSPYLHFLVNNALYEVKGDATPQLNTAFLDGNKEVVSAEGSPRPLGLIVARKYPWLIGLWLAALLLGSGSDELNLLFDVLVRRDATSEPCVPTHKFG